MSGHYGKIPLWLTWGFSIQGNSAIVSQVITVQGYGITVKLGERLKKRMKPQSLTSHAPVLPKRKRDKWTEDQTSNHSSDLHIVMCIEISCHAMPRRVSSQFSEKNCAGPRDLIRILSNFFDADIASWRPHKNELLKGNATSLLRKKVIEIKSCKQYFFVVISDSVTPVQRPWTLLLRESYMLGSHDQFPRQNDKG